MKIHSSFFNCSQSRVTQNGTAVLVVIILLGVMVVLAATTQKSLSLLRREIGLVEASHTNLSKRVSGNVPPPSPKEKP